GGLPDVGQCDENSAGLFPHPDECQLYFDCSSIETTSWQPGVKGLRECEYPKLFDEFSRKCMKNVQCGSRKAITTPISVKWKKLVLSVFFRHKRLFEKENVQPQL
ncbi:hypothetical protein MAR_006550, partial [Mya arenaria]